MNSTRFLAIVAMLALQPAWGQDVPKLPCAKGDKKCAYEAMRMHAAVRIDAWKAALSVPVGERIGPASPQLVEYLNLENIQHEYPDRPRAVELDAGLRADLKVAIAGLPRAIWGLFGERLAGIRFVANLGGTGYTDYVLDQDGRPVAAFIVFDAEVLMQQTANAWATWKESTPFKAGKAYKLDARIAADGDDNRSNAIQYILLHELGHVLAVGSDVHPPWDIRPREVARSAKYPFFDLSWKVDRKANKYRSLFDAQLPQRGKLAYYFGAKLSAADMVATYANLKNTNFPSLYAATRPGDDFAEAFASYVHVVLMKRPWQITITRNGRVAQVFKACWEEPRCAKKRAMLEQLLKRPA